MDRDLLFAIMVAVLGTALVASFYFGGSPTPATLSTEADPSQAEERVYAPNDIRYRPQQQLKDPAKARKHKAVQATSAPEPSDDSGSVDEGSIDDTSVTDHAPVGEPDIE